MERTYKSVEDMLKGLEVEKETVSQVQREINEHNLVRLLIALRCKAGLTQKQISEKMHCGQSRISKIENSRDRNLNLGDILDYAGALGLNLEISLLPEMTVVEKIKMHAFRIKDSLKELCNLVRDDDKMMKGALKVHSEAFVNLAMIITDSAKKLVNHHKQSPGKLSVSTSISVSENIVAEEACA